VSKAKPWQIVLVVAAVVAAGITVYRFVTGSSGVDLAGKIQMVDVNTGESFYLKVGSGPGSATIPGRNPKTGEKTLLPVIEENGKLVFAQRYFVSLPSIPGTHAAVDPATREAKMAAQ
jgi:hypothetical protein